MSNFIFLKDKWELLYDLVSSAEEYIYSDPAACIFKLGLFSEKIVEAMFALDNISTPDYKDNVLVKKIEILCEEGLLPDNIEEILTTIRKNRNKAVHEAVATRETAETMVQMAFSLSCWFMETYGDWEFQAPEFVMPVDHSAALNFMNIMAEKEQKIEDALKVEFIKPASPLVSIRARAQKSQEAARKTKLSEAETRLIIDQQLRDAHWIADSATMRHAKGERPEKGKNKAIAEWPTDSEVTKGGYADYALFVGLKLVGIVEAKAKHVDIPSAIDYQCRDYAQHIKEDNAEYVIRKWDKYQVPFVFAANGRKYLKQLEEKSGIWFLDTRKKTNISKPLQGFISPDGIMEYLEKDIESADEKLRQSTYDILTDKDGLNLRKYQLKAIEATEKAVMNGAQTALLAMATGTGKTRTVLGMIYRFLDAKRFKRVLFLVDRTSLGEQAQDVFQEVKIADLLTIDNMFDIKKLEDKEIEKVTKIHIATVQSMVKRIIYNSGDYIPNVSDYDLIVIDEAHRGYTLDKDLGEDEILYRDQRDFVSKYRSVIEYFDAVKIAVTATPAIHTTEIFGKPVFNYSYREAVLDGFLIDHDAPHNITTKLSEEGIHYKSGETVAIYDPVTGEITNSEELEDELSFDVDSFNKQVITESFNRTVLTEIAQYIDPFADGKTLIFAVNDLHADMIVRILKEIYEPYELDNEAILKITGSVGGGNKEKVKNAIKKFKIEKMPNIAVTVDLLTTGIDVPKICNLVFMRRVKSRILYEQMLGRATRPCPDIAKARFEIYDAVRLYETLEKVNTMKPVVVNPNTSFVELLKGFDSFETEAQKKNQIDLIIAKLQRKKRSMNEKALENFVDLSNGSTPDQFIDKIREMPAADAEVFLKNNEKLFAMLNEGETSKSRPLFISNKEDELASHTRGYGKGTKPDDYLMEFKHFIEENMNKIAALNIICTRPKDLTREALKSLALELDRHYFTEIQLNTAWREMTNEDITADLISFIRQQALGSALISHEERMKQAFDKIRNDYDFNAIQKNWLDKIEAFMKKENILNKDTFNEGEFQKKGGFKRFNAIFDGKLESILSKFNDYLYDEGA